MLLRSTLYSFLLLLACSSCEKADAWSEETREETNNIVVSVNTRSLTEYSGQDKGIVGKMDILCFAQKPGEQEYTYETTYSSNLAPDAEAQNINLSIPGNLPRLFYFFTNLNNVAGLITGELTGITADQFEKEAIIVGSNASMNSDVLVAKQVYTSAEPTKNISADLVNVVACLDICNECTDLVIDSLVLSDITSGVYAFNNNLIDANRLQTTYGNVKEIYIYPTDSSTLTIHGKYKNVRMVLDVALNNIQKNTKYKVALLLSEDSSLPSSDVITKVSPWGDGGYNDFIPDWK